MILVEEKGKAKVEEDKYITKTIIMKDGTYGTQSVLVSSKEQHKGSDSFLRTTLLSSSYFFAANLVFAITKLLVRIYSQEKACEVFNSYYFNTINIICSILNIESKLVFKDPDNTGRINMCLDFLINGNLEELGDWITVFI